MKENIHNRDVKTYEPATKSPASERSEGPGNVRGKRGNKHNALRDGVPSEYATKVELRVEIDVRFNSVPRTGGGLPDGIREEGRLLSLEECKRIFLEMLDGTPRL
jgi:hypothetical protein